MPVRNYICPMFIIIAALVILFIAELVYFRIASHYNIIDKPNHRSSHSGITIRGGGIIFPAAGILGAVYVQDYYFFTIGLVLISAVSFMDDVRGMTHTVRSFFQFISVGLLIAEIGPDIPLYWYLLVFVLIVGTINAWNFMDGINGITGGYSLVTLGSLYYVNEFIHSFTSADLLVGVMVSLLVFNFFNFRKNARCFAGDVGSVSIAFMVSFLLLQLIMSAGTVLFIGFLLIYGLDAVTTLLLRLIRRENIFEAHRSHFYQFLANEKRWPHLRVAALYVLLQGVINIFLIQYSEAQDTGSDLAVPLLILCTGGGILVVLIRWKMEGKERLFGTMSANRE